ncbi:hypothetical protein MTQ22_00125 [Corynebacterium bovis]|uniref:hypothetical protein n=1 Tax=Corynebacterium bovis TaxID=36808 RepID=UPI003138F2F2
MTDDPRDHPRDHPRDGRGARRGGRRPRRVTGRVGRAADGGGTPVGQWERDVVTGTGRGRSARGTSAAGDPGAGGPGDRGFDENYWRDQRPPHWS